MARFLFGVLPTRGHMYPSLPIAYALRARGHAVAFVTVPEFQHLLEPAGIAYFPLDRDQAEPAAMARRERRSEEGREAAKQAFRDAFVAPMAEDMRAIRQAGAAWRPDVIVNDYVSYGALLAAEADALPIATLNMTVMTWPGESLGPFGLGLPPARDEATRARYAALRARSEAYYDDILAAFNDARARVGLPARPGPLALAALSPYLQIVQTVPELDYDRRDLPPQVHYVGPCGWDPPAPLDTETAAWIGALPDDRPLVLVAASGAFARSAGIVAAALTGLAESPIAVLATLPFDHPLHQSAAFPAHLRLLRFAAHSQLLAHTRLVVTHGGFGTVTKALVAGLPLVVVPYGADQPEVAQRVATAGAGLRLDPATLSPMVLRQAVATVLHDDGYRTAAARLRAAMARHEGPGEAATLLERLARTGRPVVRLETPAEPAIAGREA